MNLAHELPSLIDVDELPECYDDDAGPKERAKVDYPSSRGSSKSTPGGPAHRHRGPKPYMQPRRPSEFGRTYVPHGKPFVPDWALDRSLLPKKPPGAR